MLAKYCAGMKGGIKACKPGIPGIGRDEVFIMSEKLAILGSYRTIYYCLITIYGSVGISNNFAIFLQT